jgi:hypothetical protein
MSVVIPFLFSPTKNSRVMQQSPLPCFLSVDFLPLGDRNFLCPVATSEPRKSVLKNSRRMLEKILTFSAFCTNIEADLRLMKCPIHVA